ncbi:hypothetical protein [Candidatus Babela massiliensis]|uniref:Uncharacterized protein n=1 Tax=Candidatus Babela massiliensis TaxID=673862 RepID=V6DGI4_9BACT|nr:hypothetical protein [Candidatus Babela massiliensis]CDK30712.1 hypothetical protein BABL1_gene_303 [Candidatus Babela massiliensis]
MKKNILILIIIILFKNSVVISGNFPKPKNPHSQYSYCYGSNEPKDYDKTKSWWEVIFGTKQEDPKVDPSPVSITETGPSIAHIKENMTINDKTTLEQIRDLLDRILKEIQKGPINIFNVNMQEGNKLTNALNLQNNNLNHNVNNNINIAAITDYAKKEFGLIIDWIKNNKFKVTMTALTSSYILINAKLIYLNYKLANENCWSKWRLNSTMEELYRVPQAIFAQDLLKDIQNTYTQIGNMTDYVTPLSTFIKDVDTEINNINTYIRMIKFLHKTKVRKFFIYNTKIYDQAPERLNRLLFIKNTFLSWLAEHKISQFKHLRKLNLI